MLKKLIQRFKDWKNKPKKYKSKYYVLKCETVVYNTKQNELK